MHPLIDILNSENPMGHSEEWRKTVLSRDASLCQVCGSSESVEAHHIIPKYLCPEFTLSPTNGITLCSEHHHCFHARHFTKIGAKRGRTPYGYKRENGGFAEIPSEIKTINRIQRLWGEGYSHRAIAHLLDTEGIPAKLGGKWNKSSIHNITGTRSQPMEGRR